jgi:hypothetical protein
MGKNSPGNGKKKKKESKATADCVSLIIVTIVADDQNMI